MARYFLGVDIGNTKSHALVADEAGRVLGFAKGGLGNWEAIGWDGARAVMQQLVADVCSAASVRPGQIAGAGFGLAGYDWPEDRAPYTDIIRSLGLGGPFELVNDALIGLLAGSAEGWGVCIAAGTSCNCYGRDWRGNIGRVTGSSGWFGEHAGANEIVRRAIQAVARAWTRRAPATQLSEAFVRLCGAQNVEDLLAGLVRSRYRITAANARTVFDVAAAGDEVAQEIICWAGQGLGDLAAGVIRQLSLEALAFDVVLAGTVYNENRSLVEPTRQVIHSVAPQARLVPLQAPPVLGSVLLGMEQLQLDLRPAREQLLASARELLQEA